MSAEDVRSREIILGLAHGAKEIVFRPLGIPGLIEGAKTSWVTNRSKRRSVLGTIAPAFGSSLLTGAANFIAPLSHKNLSSERSAGIKILKLPFTVSLDAATSAIAVASLPFLHLGAPVLKAGLNAGEIILWDGMGAIGKSIRRRIRANPWP